jgi:hypothetical protein
LFIKTTFTDIAGSEQLQNVERTAVHVYVVMEDGGFVIINAYKNIDFIAGTVSFTNLFCVCPISCVCREVNGCKKVAYLDWLSILAFGIGYRCLQIPDRHHIISVMPEETVSMSCVEELKLFILYANPKSVVESCCCCLFDFDFRFAAKLCRL